MNYRHAYHAGNFADVMKHLTLVLVLEYLKRKDKPLCYVDTHAGAGLYDLASDAARRSGEWRNGIGRLAVDGWPALVDPLDAEPQDLLRPYIDVVTAVNDDLRETCQDADETGACLQVYPGSCLIAQRLLRAGDRLILNELHGEDAKAMRDACGRDRRVKTLELDGWTVVKSVLPPKERRGVLLIDPPFEIAGEFGRLETALNDATERFETGTTLLWYPIKAGSASESFVRRMRASGHRRLLLAELLVRHRDTVQGLNGSGLIIHNPPYQLAGQLGRLLPWLADRLKQQPGASSRLEWLAGE